jgi:hypothetical protein
MYDEVEAELAKKDEEIARFKKGEEQLAETATLLAVEIARLRKALEKIRTMHAGSLIGSHYRDSIVDVASKALAKEE